MTAFFARLLMGTGKLPERVRGELQSEGLVLIEEGLTGSVRYAHFKAPGRRHYGTIIGARVGIGVSRERLAVYSRSGRAKLIDSPFSTEGLDFVEVTAEDEDRLIIHIDYDRGAVPDISGKVGIHARTPDARSIAEQIRTRIAGND